MDTGGPSTYTELEAKASANHFDSKQDDIKFKLDWMHFRLDSIESSFMTNLSVSHNPYLTYRDTINGNDHEERGGEDRAIHEDPDVDVVVQR
uniref:Uncharacterized protein n=1 Tax=Cucumis sativus TaxID=3659 RepID=A0A0A0K798_CUCSA